MANFVKMPDGYLNLDNVLYLSCQKGRKMHNDDSSEEWYYIYTRDCNGNGFNGPIGDARTKEDAMNTISSLVGGNKISTIDGDD